MSTADIIEVQIENKEYVDGKWTTFDSKLPDGVYVLRVQDSSGEWFNRKARFERRKGWTEATAEEWAIKQRPQQAAGIVIDRTLDLQSVIAGVPRLSEEEMDRRHREEDKQRKKEERRRRERKKFSFRQMFSRGKDDSETRMSPDEVKLNHIYNGDCIEVMQSLPDNFFDAVITDPPYNLGKKYKSGIDDGLRATDYYKWSYAWIDEAVRVLKPRGQLLIALWDRFKYHIKVYIDEQHSNKLRFIQEIAWKTTGVPRPPSGKLRSDMTPWLHYGPRLYKGEPHINYTWNMDNVRSWKFVKGDINVIRKNKRYIHPLGKDPSTLWEFYHESRPNEFRSDAGERFYTLNWMRKFLEVFSEYSSTHAIELYNLPSNIIDQRNLPSTHRDRLDHPCQMPVEVPLRLVELVTNPGDNILEPFNGTGTTAAAAYVKGRNCTSIELSPDYVHMALDRLRRDKLVKQAAVEYWDGRPPFWDSDPCTPQFKDPGQKTILDFFAAGTSAGKRLGDDLVFDIAQEATGIFDL